MDCLLVSRVCAALPVVKSPGTPPKHGHFQYAYEDLSGQTFTTFFLVDGSIKSKDMMVFWSGA